MKRELVNALIGSIDAHNDLSSQALSSEMMQQGLLDILLDTAALYGALKKRSA